ncbi:MAG: hypothetical protein HC836_14620 [Richelia sp. RM2_1_2]|nr:hypothetical protein [Richelia sp. SM2_1_7]NJM18831.1 hypothetical protein [Richelia sp. SM1_7_0]NJN07720.1 hypothetical protein [Richelia sp. RM1_1_1]NJO27329.1 hypothetical protein [Richelia sp. SL_2_1]NJO59484.1 hypothetical protein [Richelia sp. RM2_1_2]
MTTKQTISILALSVLIALPAGIASADKIQVQNGDTSVRINRNGDIQIQNARRRRFYRPRIYRGSAIRVPTRRIYPHNIRNMKKLGNCTTYNSTYKSGSEGNSSHVQTRTTTCQ